MLGCWIHHPLSSKIVTAADDVGSRVHHKLVETLDTSEQVELLLSSNRVWVSRRERRVGYAVLSLHLWYLYRYCKQSISIELFIYVAQSNDINMTVLPLRLRYVGVCFVWHRLNLMMLWIIPFPVIVKVNLCLKSHIVIVVNELCMFCIFRINIHNYW